MSRLEEILTKKREEVELLRSRPPMGGSHQPLDVPCALRMSERLALIAEIKFRSPSAGTMSRVLDAQARALVYARSGAAMISVLCDAPFFGGSFDDLALVRAALDEAGLPTPLLAKEFVIDDAQLARAREAGADAALLIARILPDGALSRLVNACRHRSLEPFVEVATKLELDRALDAGAVVIGVNARDLDTLAIDSDAARRVLEEIPPRCVAVHLSGLRTEKDVAACANGRADAALIGEALMKLDEPSDLLKRMLAATRK